MAVELTGTEQTFVGTGVSSTYTPGFYASQSNQVYVYVDGALKSIGTDYALNGVGDQDGVNVVAIFASGASVLIKRMTPITQEVDTQNNETILENVLDGEFDKLTMICQELSALIAKLTAGDGSSSVGFGSLTASEVIAIGAPVNIYTNAGVTYARNADATDPLKPALGFAAAGAGTIGSACLVAFGGVNVSAPLGLTEGEVFLSETAGQYTFNSPTTVGHLSQSLGYYIPGVGLVWSAKQAILL